MSPNGYFVPASVTSRDTTAHFKKYKTTTQDMVKSLELRNTVAISLGVKTKRCGAAAAKAVVQANSEYRES